MSSLSLSPPPGNNSTVEARLSPPQILPKVKRDQHKKLEERFKECRNPNDIDLMLIAAEVGLSEIDTKVRIFLNDHPFFNAITLGQSKNLLI